MSMKKKYLKYLILLIFCLPFILYLIVNRRYDQRITTDILINGDLESVQNSQSIFSNGGTGNLFLFTQFSKCEMIPKGNSPSG